MSLIEHLVEFRQRLIKAALAVVDVDVLDHFIVTRRDVYSFAENHKL